MSNYNQRDIVEVPFPINVGGKATPHPALIISTKAVYEEEGFYQCLLMTSSLEVGAEFAFIVKPDMLTFTPNREESYIKVQMIAAFLPSHIRKRFGTMRAVPFRRVLEMMNKETFNFTCPE